MPISNSYRDNEGLGRSCTTVVSSARQWGVAVLLLCLVPGLGRAGTLATFDTSLGSFQVDFFDDVVPETVENFVSYINSGAFDDTVVHRTTIVANAGIGVIQGGGYTYNAATGLFESITPAAPIALQYVLDNHRGTIAMARTSIPDSATSQWFINTAEANAALLNEANGGGYAVFGWVMGDGMDVVDAINALPTGSVGIFNEVPYTPPAPITESNLVFTNSVAIAETHPSFQNPIMVTDVNNSNFTTPADALAIINQLLAFGIHEASADSILGTKYAYVDPSGDGFVTPHDVLLVINKLLSQAGPPPVAPQVSPFVSAVPEPSSLALGAAALLAFSVLGLGGRCCSIDAVD